MIQNLSEPAPQNRTMLIALSLAIFIALGFPIGLIGLAWPSIRQDYMQPLSALGLLLGANTAGYMISTFFTSKLIERWGMGMVMTIGSLVMGGCMVAFTFSPSFLIMMAINFVVGLGSGAVDAAINTYLASAFTYHTMQWLHASFGVGITMGLGFMTAGLNILDDWRFGFQVSGGIIFLMAGVFYLTRAVWQAKMAPEHVQSGENILEFRTPILETLRKPVVWLSLSLFFIYAGLQISLGHWAYTLLTESRGVDQSTAALFTGSYWVFFTIGRLLSGAFGSRVKLNTLLLGALSLALSGILLLWWNPMPWISVLGVSLTGLAISPIFPGLISGTIGRVGARDASNTVGMQMTAGGFSTFAVPGLAGVLAERFSLEIIPPFMAALYVVLLLLFIASVRNAAIRQNQNIPQEG